jgi:beta-1,4-mannosyltransferase
MDERKCRVAMDPAWCNRAQTQYNSLLADGLVRCGLDVEEAFPAFRRFWRYDVLHLHWPEYIFAGRRGWLRGPFFLLTLAAFKVRGGVVVQTLHNVVPHDRPSSLVRVGTALVDSATDAVFAHDVAVFRDLRQRRPRLRRCHTGSADHPASVVARDEAIRKTQRKAWGLGDETVACLHFGLLRAYKGTLDLAAAWKEASPCSLLICAGRPDGEVLAGLSDFEGAPGMRFDLRLLPEDELEAHLLGADVAILPYRQITTSGSLWHALGAGLPVVMPLCAAATHARTIVGDDWIYIYDGQLDADVINAAIQFGRRKRGALKDLPSTADLVAATVKLYNAARGSTDEEC